MKIDKLESNNNKPEAIVKEVIPYWSVVVAIGCGWFVIWIC